MIKSVYSESNGYAGYFNYMKYWAKNGDVDWICNTEEYNIDGGLDGYDFNKKGKDKDGNEIIIKKDNNTNQDGGTTIGVMHSVDYTYLVTNFWNNYDGTKSPLDGSTCQANSFEKKSA